jgi:hypothetical protein
MKRGIVAALVAVTALLLAAPAVSAADATATKATLRLVSQTPWVTSTQPLVVELEANGLTDTIDLDLVATIYPAVGVRSAFEQTLTGKGLGRASRTVTVPLASLPTTARGAVSVTYALPRLDEPPSSTTLPALERGVYPMSLAVRPHGGGTTQASLTTYLVRLSDTTGGVPLEVAWVQPISATPTASASASKPLSDADHAAISALLVRLASNPLVPVALDLTPDTVAALSPADLQTLRGLLDARHPPLAAPYVDIDPAALVAAGRGDDIALQRQIGEELLAGAIGSRGDPRTWSVERPLSAFALQRLRALGVTRLVLPESTLKPLNSLTRTLTSPYSLDSGDGDVIEAVSADDGLAAHFRNTGDQVLAAHQLLADLAVLYLDAPSQPHGVVIRPPASWRPSAAFLDAVLPALSNAPILEPATLEQLLADVPAYSANGKVTTRTLLTTARIGTLPAVQLAQAQTTLDQLASLYGPATDQAGAARRLLLASESDRLTTRRRTNVLARLDATLASLRGNLHLPNGRTFRLTARSGTIPLTVANTNPFEVHIDIVLSSDKLEFTDVHADDRSRLVLAGVVVPANSTLTRAVPVKARASATFSLQAAVNAPTGQTLDRSRFTIISTAFSGVGIVLSIGAALFLALWWARHWRTARRDHLRVDADH